MSRIDLGVCEQAMTTCFRARDGLNTWLSQIDIAALNQKDRALVAAMQTQAASLGELALRLDTRCCEIADTTRALTRS